MFESAGRAQHLERLVSGRFDVLVVGGGINGCISALALTRHGLRVALIEANDFSSGVSQESSNLIWGGIKYLQTYDFALVAELCRSRNRLARAYPSLVKQVRFLAALGQTAPYKPAYAAMGAHAYWALGRFATDRPTFLTAASVESREPAIDPSGVTGGIEYSDYLLVDNDARMVLNFLLDAIDSGATAVSRVRLDGVARNAQGLTAQVTDEVSGVQHQVCASMVVNAGGPRAAEVAQLAGSTLKSSLMLSKGVHVVVPRVTDTERVLTFFDDDERLFYVIPMGYRSLVGTTDTPAVGADVTADPGDIDFLLDQVNHRLRLGRKLEHADVISHRCGVRPLVVGADEQDRDWINLSRRHVVEVDDDARVVSILGGKLSDCINVGAEVVEAAGECGLTVQGAQRTWFGEPPEEQRSAFAQRAEDAGIGAATAARLWRRHGRRANEVVDVIVTDPELGEDLSEVVNYSAAEVTVMARHEQIVTLEDFQRRRTMLAMLEPAEVLSKDPGMQKVAQLIHSQGQSLPTASASSARTAPHGAHPIRAAEPPNDPEASRPDPETAATATPNPITKWRSVPWRRSDREAVTRPAWMRSPRTRSASGGARAAGGRGEAVGGFQKRGARSRVSRGRGGRGRVAGFSRGTGRRRGGGGGSGLGRMWTR